MKLLKLSEMSFKAVTTVYKELYVGELHDGSPLHIPFAVIDGREPGKTLLVASGINGNIYNGIEATRRILLEVKPEKIRGRLVVLPIINRPAFLTRSRANTFENFPGPTQMVGSFPGSSEGIFTERIWV